MQYEFDRSFKMKINDDEWFIALLTEEEATETDQLLNDSSDGFRALTVIEDKCMFFVEENVSKGTVTHELFHLYVSYLHLGSTSIDTDNFEEIIAEFLESNLDKFIKTRNKIYNKLRKLEGAI